MDSATFSQLINELVLVNDRVSLPGMGSFIVETVPAQIVDRGRTIIPPARKLYFRTTETWNDGLLEERYARLMNKNIEEAVGEVSEFVLWLKRELVSRRSYTLEGLGDLKYTPEGTIYFIESRDIEISPDSYGLEPVNLKLIRREVHVQDNIRTDDMSSDSQDSEKNGTGKSGNEKPEAETRSSGLYMLLVILAVILSAAIVIFFFRDELYSFLQSLFYSGEELDLIRKYNL